jgi:hypothetical protein
MLRVERLPSMLSGGLSAGADPGPPLPDDGFMRPFAEQG